MLRPIFDQTTDRSVKNRRKKEPKEYILEKIGQGPIDWKILVGKLIAGKWLFHFDAGIENRIQK